MKSLHLAFVALAWSGGVAFSAPSVPAISIPAPAQERLATTQVRVVPDRPNWTYQPGEKVSFRVSLVWDQHPLEQVAISYRVGPEMMDLPEKKAVVPAEGLVIDGGTMTNPGFLRCVVTADIGGKTYRGLATAGFAPEKIVPTQVDPADFDAFWSEQKAQLAKLPVDARLTLQPDLCTAKVEVFHVSLQNVGILPGSTSRMYGILCVPRGEGRFPAVLNVPGAGVRPYRGQVELAEKGVITLQVGIHGIPVNLPQELYDQLGAAALNGYNVFNLDHRERYYYRRVYLGCVRANDFLTSFPKWNKQSLVVMGGSQGGQLSITTAALDPRVTALACNYPAYSDVTGYLHGRAGGWPHMMRNERNGAPSHHATDAKRITTQYYDAVNFARRLKVPGFYSWGYNDETCPPTSLYAAYHVITAPKRLLLALEMGHATTPEQNERIQSWVLEQSGVK
ncbi:MAG: acetylxylan esterase [Opitutaceae bacterium]|nr:acetylxylan esterase [Opitutaceae bacterium]